MIKLILQNMSIFDILMFTQKIYRTLVRQYFIFIVFLVAIDMPYFDIKGDFRLQNIKMYTL